MSLQNRLKEFYSETGNERVGFILKNNHIREVPNIADDPENAFMLLSEDIQEYLLSGKAVATFHTHPGASANLSVSDYIGFQNYPDVDHYVVGKDGVRKYEVEEDGTIIQSED